MQYKNLAMLCVVAMSATACTTALSHNISDKGTVAKENIVFPALDTAWEKDGQFPNSENLSKIRAGVGKDELYQLIGRPHFSERQHAREWDYIMKFYQKDQSVKICQYKVIFDKDYKGQEFYWKPADCAQYATPKTHTPQIIYQQVPAPAPQIIYTPAPAPAPQPVPLINEKINLGADALFNFDKWQTHEMKPEGRRQLDELAQKLREWQTRGDSRVMITGHTDRLGDDMYNLNLSQLRAQTVRAYLAERGVDPATMSAAGAGETQQVKQCADSLGRQKLIECLQPNRRVEVDVAVFAPRTR